jgi:hypothetical protein
MKTPVSVTSDLHAIPGIGRTLVKDFVRIGITGQRQLRGKNPERLFARLCKANKAEGHATSKNYLYVLRMAVYYASGGREKKKLQWWAWKDATPPTTSRRKPRQAAV